MAHSHVLLGAGADPAKLTIRRIGIDDLKEALAKGADDFYAMPTHAMFLCAIYPVVGLLAARLAFGYSVLPLLYPLVTGFALVGPLAALGLYELSRRREAGQQASAAHAFDVLKSSSIGAIIALGLLLMGIFALWIAVANAIYVAEFGYATPASIGGFVRDVLTTQSRLEPDRARQFHRLFVRGAGAGGQRHLVPAAARPRRRRGGGAADLAARGARAIRSRWASGA